MPSNDTRCKLLPTRAIESFWHTMWLGIQPFFCFIVKSRRIACRCLHTMHGAICCRIVPSRASGTPCGSAFGRFCVSTFRAEMSRHFSRRNASAHFMQKCVQKLRIRHQRLRVVPKCSDDPLMRRHSEGAGNCATPFGVRHLLV